MIAGLAAGTLAAQSFEVGGHGGTMRLSNKSLGQLGIRDLTRVELDDGWRIGFRTTFNNWRFLGHEVGYAYNRTKLVIGNDEAGFGVHQGFYNFLAYATPEGSRVRPFVAGGGHFNNFVPPGASATSGQGDTKFGFNYGGGIKVKLNHMFGMRLDMRQYVTGKPFDLPNQTGKLRQTEISAGFYLWM